MGQRRTMLRDQPQSKELVEGSYFRKSTFKLGIPQTRLKFKQIQFRLSKILSTKSFCCLTKSRANFCNCKPNLNRKTTEKIQEIGILQTIMIRNHPPKKAAVI